MARDENLKRSHSKWAQMYGWAEDYYQNNRKIPSDGSESKLRNWLYNETRWMKQTFKDSRIKDARTEERIRLLGLIGITPTYQDNIGVHWEMQKTAQNKEERSRLLKNHLIRNIDLLIDKLKIIHNVSYISVLKQRADKRAIKLEKERKELEEATWLYDVLEPDSFRRISESERRLDKLTQKFSQQSKDLELLAAEIIEPSSSKNAIEAERRLDELAQKYSEQSERMEALNAEKINQLKAQLKNILESSEDKPF